MDRSERFQRKLNAWEESFYQELDHDGFDNDPDAQRLFEEAHKHVSAIRAKNARYYEELAIRNDLSKLERRIADCWLCGQTKPTHIHHVDGNHRNDARNNRAVLCEQCHVEIHKRKQLIDNDDFAVMRNFYKSRHPERFELNERNPFDRPNSIVPRNEQLGLF